MPAPLAKGIIIAASVLVAAGIAIYESPQVRQWVDQSRRKIAIALHSLGDEIQPRRPSECSEDFEARKADIIRQRRNELIRRARQEGIAVDLDELASIGRDDVEMSPRTQRRQTNASQKSFDDLVGHDGKLRSDGTGVQKATGTKTSNGAVRRRGMAGFTAGSAAASNPFSDDAQVLFDGEDEEAKSPEPFPYVESRESSATLGRDVAPSLSASGPLVDLVPAPDNAYGPEYPQTASIPQSEADGEDDEQNKKSFYSFASSSVLGDTTHPDLLVEGADSDAENPSTGTLTPRSERSAFTSASVVGSHADDIAVISMQNDTDHDDRSEVFSEGGFTDAGFSQGGSQRGVGVMTPSSWTDVGSDDESEWGGPAQGGQIRQ